jgi:hypothetical protein
MGIGQVVQCVQGPMHRVAHSELVQNDFCGNLGNRRCPKGKHRFGLTDAHQCYHKFTGADAGSTGQREDCILGEQRAKRGCVQNVCVLQPVNSWVRLAPRRSVSALIAISTTATTAAARVIWWVAWIVRRRRPGRIRAGLLQFTATAAAEGGIIRRICGHVGP